MSFDWKAVVGTVAPILMKTVQTTNPLAGMALSAISQAFLGKPDGKEEEVSAYLERAKPEDLVKLKEVETTFKLDMKNADVDLEKIYADDRADARGKEERTDDPTPKVLAAVFIFGYIAFLIVILWKGVPQDSGTKEVILILVGVMAAAITQILNYYFGSSKGSSDKTKLLAKASG